MANACASDNLLYSTKCKKSGVVEAQGLERQRMYVLLMILLKAAMGLGGKSLHHLSHFTLKMGKLL